MSDVALVIDGTRVRVPRGTTILEAARSVGIRIPTLCHVQGLDPAASCFLCSVQVEGARTLSPACALPAAEGMVVVTDSDDIRATRKMALELLLSDHAGDCVAPCSARCPAGLDVSAYVLELARGENDRAMEVIFDSLSLPGTLGRVCPRLCEERCKRCEHDGDGLAIAALHRYAGDRNRAAARPLLPRPGPPSGRSVAIVGAGPAGLTAAFYLRRLGHACTLFDANALPGGMLRYGIPAYRLPRRALDDEIAVIEGLGAEFRPNRRWGRDFTLADLRREHDAVFLAIGAQLSQGLRCEGEELALAGLDLLRAVAEGDAPGLGRRVAVIGGGNTAMDAARTVARLGAEARVLYRRTRDEMPCLLEEVEGAEEEGIRFEFLAAPVRLRRLDNGSGLLLTCRRMELGEPDDSGRRRPLPVEGSDFDVECDTVVAAVGQSVDGSLAEREGLEVTRWGIAADPATLATGLPGVFAGGDAVLGADLAVRAVAAGRIAATSIGQYLAGEPVRGPAQRVAIALEPMDDLERAAVYRGIETSPRVATARLGIAERRTGFGEIDQGLTDAQALDESGRCMTCNCRKSCDCSLRVYGSEYGVDPYRFQGRRRRFEQDTTHPEVVYEPGKCIMCDACVQIARGAGEEVGVAISGRGFDVSVAVPFGQTLSEGLKRVARRCAEACPTGALALRSERSCDLRRVSSGLLQIGGRNGGAEA